MPHVNKFLAYCERELLEYLQDRHETDGNFDLADIEGYRQLSQPQKDEVAIKFQGVKTLDDTVSSEELYSRLRRLAKNQEFNQAVDPEFTFPRRPIYSGDSTPLDQSDHDPAEAENSYIALGSQRIRENEKACFEELIELELPPVTSFEAIGNLGFRCVSPYDAELPWHESGENLNGFEHLTVFKKQLESWWRFRKSQWHYRNISDEPGIVAFIESQRRVDTLSKGNIDPKGCGYERNLRKSWIAMDGFPRIADDDDFTKRKYFTKDDVSRHEFQHGMDLKEDPRQQTAWDNWLEYLSYEMRCESDMNQNHHDLHVSIRQDIITLSEASIDIMRMSEGCHLDSLHAIMTTAQRLSESLFHFQQQHAEMHELALRVEWIVQEARRMDAELTAEANEGLCSEFSSCSNDFEGFRHQAATPSFKIREDTPSLTEPSAGRDRKRSSDSKECVESRGHTRPRLYDSTEHSHLLNTECTENENENRKRKRTHDDDELVESQARSAPWQRKQTGDAHLQRNVLTEQRDEACKRKRTDESDDDERLGADAVPKLREQVKVVPPRRSARIAEQKRYHDENSDSGSTAPLRRRTRTAKPLQALTSADLEARQTW